MNPTIAEYLLDVARLAKASQRGDTHAANKLIEFEHNTIEFANIFGEFAADHPGVAYRAIFEEWDQSTIEFTMDLAFTLLS